MQLNATSGQGTATLGVTVAGNELGTARSGAIVVNNQRVAISQQARPCTYELRASPQNLGAAGGRGSISVDTLGGCAWTATSSAGWLRVLTPAGSGPGSVEFEVAVNDGGPRDATIGVGGQTITIAQSGGNQGGGGGTSCSLTLSPSTVNALAAGGTSSISVAAPPTCDWTASVAASSASWLSVAPGTGRGTGSVAVSSARNTGNARTGTVTVGDQTATVNQAAAPACTATIDPTSATLPHTGGDRSVRVTTQDGCEWTVTGGSPPWTQILTARGTNTGDARYSVAANTTTSPRSTTLTIAGHSHSVTQEAMPAPTCTYTLQPTSQDHPFGGGPGSFTVATQAGCTWTASAGGANWITNVTQSGNSVSYTVQANTGAARQGSITVSGGGGSASHNVTQQPVPAPSCTYTLQPGSQDSPHAGGNFQFTVATQAGCTWSASAGGANWITNVTPSGNSVSYTVQANTGAARQGSITVSGGGGSASHSVTQQPQPAQTCTYQLQPNSQNVPANGGTFNFDVNTQQNCNWQAQAGDPTWVNISSGSGSGPQRVVYSVSNNSSTSSRSTSITVGNQSHSISQAGQAPACTYTVNPGSAQFPAAGGNGSFSVSTQSGCTWTFSGGASWITNVTQNGSTVSYTVQANSTGAQRQASFSVNFSGGSQSHGVTQLP